MASKGAERSTGTSAIRQIKDLSRAVLAELEIRSANVARNIDGKGAFGFGVSAANEILRPGTVDVWVARYSEQVDRLSDLAGLLSKAEWSRADSLLNNRTRSDYIVRRALLREIVSRYTCEAPEKIVIELDPLGKPHLPRSRNIHFNVTRTEDLFMVAVSGSAIGIDVEKIRWLDDVDALAQSIMSGNEIKAFSRLEPDRKQVHFLRLWTAKEASLKAIGIGLRADPKLVDVRALGTTGKYSVVIDWCTTFETLFARSIRFDRMHVATLASGYAQRIKIRRVGGVPRPILIATES